MRRFLLALACLLAAVPAVAQQPRTSGTITAGGVDCSVSTRCVGLNMGEMNGTAAIVASGFGSATITVEISSDATSLTTGTWTAQNETYNLATGAASSTFTASGYYVVPMHGATWVRARASTYASGTIAIVLGSSSAPSGVAVTNFPASQAVTGTFWQATQPVSGTFWQATQPVSGSVTAVQGTGSNLHIVCDSGCSSSAGFGDNSAFTFGTSAINPIGGVFDDVGSNTATENSAAVARITQNKALHVNFRNASGTEIGTSSNPIQVSLANTATNSTAVKVDGSAVTQPVTQKDSGGTSATDTTAHAVKSLNVDSTGTAIPLADGNQGAPTANTTRVVVSYPTLASGGTSAMTGTTSTQVIAAVASNYVYVSSCSVGNTHASVDTLVDLQDGSGGTVIWTFTAAHNYAGESHTFLLPLKVPTLGNGLYAKDETTGASVKVFCQGFVSTVSY